MALGRAAASPPTQPDPLAVRQHFKKPFETQRSPPGRKEGIQVRQPTKSIVLNTLDAFSVSGFWQHFTIKLGELTLTNVVVNVNSFVNVFVHTSLIHIKNYIS